MKPYIYVEIPNNALRMLAHSYLIPEFIVIRITLAWKGSSVDGETCLFLFTGVAVGSEVRILVPESPCSQI
jgi:hypothetical protein